MLGVMKIPVKPKVILRTCSEYDPEKIRQIIRAGLDELGLRPFGRTLVKPNLVAAGDLFPHAHTRKEFTEGVDGEINRRIGLLCLLYTQRRANQVTPALSVLEIEQMMSIPREHLVFTIWYLKAKRFIQQDDRSSLLITAEGIDFLENNLPEHKTMYKMLEAADMGSSRSNGLVKTEKTAS